MLVMNLFFGKDRFLSLSFFFLQMPRKMRDHEIRVQLSCDMKFEIGNQFKRGSV